MAIKYLDSKRIRGIKGSESSTMGTAADATEVGGVTLDSTNKVFGSNSIDLDGTNDTYLNMDGVLNSMSTTGTVSYWVRNEGTAGYFLTFNRSDDAGGSSAITYMHSEQGGNRMDTTFTIGNSVQWQVKTPVDSWASSDRSWHHVVLAQDGTAVKFYFDGAEVTSFNNSTDKSKWISDLTSRDNVRFGVKNVYAQGNGGEFTGQVDDIAIWDRAITAAEVTTLYGGGEASGTPVTALGISRTGLKAYWSCNSLDGTTLPNEAASLAEDKATLVNNVPASDANWTTVTALTADTSTATPTNLDTASWDCNGADGDTTKISLTGGQIFPKDSSFTFSTWIKPDSKQTFCILDDDGGTDSVVVFAAAGGDAVEYKVWKDASTHSGGEATFSGGFAAGSWYNVVCTFDKDTGTTESYVNYSTNVNSDTEAGVTTVATNTSWKMIGNSSETYGGLMLESAIWNKVLTANERRDLYYGGSGGSGGSAGAGKKANTIASANLVCYWDGSDITAPITNQSTLVKTKIPENTLFEETDTYKTWWLQSSKWIPMPTYSGVDSTWQQTDAGADFTIDATNNEVDYHNQVNANNVYFDLNSIQTLSTSKWLIRYAVTQTGTSSGGTTRIFHGVSKTGVTASNTTSTDFVGYSIDTSSGTAVLRPHLIQCDDRVLHTSTSGSGSGHQASFPSPADNLSSNGTKYYYELSRDGANYTGSIYSDSDYSTLLGSSTHTMPNEALRYFIFSNYVDGGGISGVLSDFKYYNGISEF